MNEYCVNARFVTRPFTGVQRYSYEVSLRLRNGRFIAPSPALKEYGGLQARVEVAGGGLNGHPWEQIALPWAVPRGMPLFSPAGCGPVAYPNQVLTIHDLGPLDTPECYSRGIRTLVRAVGSGTRTKDSERSSRFQSIVDGALWKSLRRAGEQGDRGRRSGQRLFFTRRSDSRGPENP